jgi:hypothetical protein
MRVPHKELNKLIRVLVKQGAVVERRGGHIRITNPANGKFFGSGTTPRSSSVKQQKSLARKIGFAV